MSLELKDWLAIIVQFVFMTSIVVTNKVMVQNLKEQTNDLKKWLEKLSETVTTLRVEVGQIAGRRKPADHA